MENKRKAASATAAGGADGDDRVAKRRKIPAQQTYDLFRGESRESTTHYGYRFLEQIRRTSDKSGRHVAGCFETLPPRHGNADYYKLVRMPISLETIEKKLDNGDFASMSELESYVKRMVQNAKDFHPRGSQIYDDAERVRKALSNYMVKTNPAYKLVEGYTAVPTPLPDADEGAAWDEADGAEEAGEEEDADEPDADADADAEGEEDEDADGEDDDEAAKADEADEDEEEEEEEEEEDPPPVVARRRGRPPKNPVLHAQKVAERAASQNAKPDHQYAAVPYRGLSFQQAQEKIVEELIRKPDEDDDTFPYFEAFHNLPPRTLKDYYQVIKEPLSLKKLQKLVKGIHGRGERPGVTEYKNWTAFAEKASLLWQNAFYYNEDGSDIWLMAKELKDLFLDELRKAKAAVPDPPQPKIKIKMTPGSQDAPASHKKITIHVANTRASPADSSAPQTGGSVSSDGLPNGAPARNPLSVQNLTLSANVGLLDKAKTASTAAPSPSPSVAGLKREETARQSPAALPRPTSAAVAPAPTVNNTTGTPVPLLNGNGNAYPGVPLPNGTPVAAPVVPSYDQKYRAPGKGAEDALIRHLTIRTHPNVLADRRFVFDLPAHPKEAQQSVTINVPANHWKQQVIVTLAPLQEQFRPFKLFVTVNGVTAGAVAPLPHDPMDPSARLYDATLHPGMNSIQVQLIAGLAKGQKLANGADLEMEKVTVLAQYVRY